MKNIDSQKLKNLIGLSDADIKGSLTKGVTFMTVLAYTIEGTSRKVKQRKAWKSEEYIATKAFQPKKNIQSITREN
jgi:hypothetical protein